MFENLRDAFREAVKNFKEELNRDEVPETVDRLLYGMKQEAAEVKARLHDLEQGIQRAEAEALREEREIRTCRRRERMARKIGDEETARIAAEYGAKHQRRKEVLEQKARALEEELEVRKAEIDEMLEKIREAQKSRDALAASAGRTQARESIRGGDDLFDELDRMADRMGDETARSAAHDELLDELGREARTDTRPGADLDARLAELKRRMRQEGGQR